MSIIHVILSGGVGSRLWPLSTKERPKQYLPLFDDKTLFSHTVERNRPFCEQVIVVGNKDNYQLSREALDVIGLTDYTEIVEAAPRNTAAAIAFAAFSVAPEAVLLVTPSDHIISNEKAYSNAFKSAFQWAKNDYLVTFGITPHKAETGYGYIEYNGNEVNSFREKPDIDTATQFLASGRFLWNSGMFCFKAKVFLEELAQYEPELFAAAHHAWQNQQGGFLPQFETLAIPSKSIDYAVMERSQRIKVVPATFEWYDLGSYEALWDYFEAKGHDHHFRENNMVLQTGQKHVELVGVDGLVIVETENTILVLPKSKSQEVKRVYDRLKG